MSIIDQEERVSKLKKLDNATSKELRDIAHTGAKDFKTAWLAFAQTLYAIWRDKLFEYWGYDRFDQYVERELGLKKSLALRLVKTYAFVEQQEPEYLKKEYLEERNPASLPEVDAIHVLRLAKGKKELTRQDYSDLRRQVFDKGSPAAVVRKDLAVIMKERKQVDPDEERAQRSAAAVRKFLNAIRSFKKDAETLKLIKANLVKKAEELFKELEAEIEQ
ncbi:MAG: hypothetical protein HQL18_01175 [Candidatus Omnitrophica bacterium]|nr:hypothetical protein [Candidatus Omnitrophota bacterium]